MIVFSGDPARKAEVFNAMEYVRHALTSNRLVVTEHLSNPKTSQPWWVLGRGGGRAVAMGVSFSFYSDSCNRRPREHR